MIFENRPFGIDAVANPPNATGLAGGTYQVEGETVVEAIFGHSGNIQGSYGAGADRTVLLRWYASEADPVVKPGDWIADVTYERQRADGLQLEHRFGPIPERHPAGQRVPKPVQQRASGTTCRPSGASGTRCRRSTPAIDDPYTNQHSARCVRWSSPSIARSRRGRS